MFPGIRAALDNPNQPVLPVQTINKYLDNLRYVNSNVSGTDLRLYFTMAAARTYPTGKQYLLGKGFAAEQVSAMPVTQVALMYALALFDEVYDDLYKWQNFPAWQARPGLLKARQQFDQRRTEHPEAMFLAAYMMPALNNVMVTRARLDRRLAMLEVVEALRLYAAGAGKLPGRLGDIQDVPIPLDPVTGKVFEYTVENNRAVLWAPAPPEEADHERGGVRYEITLAAGTKP